MYILSISIAKLILEMSYFFGVCVCGWWTQISYSTSDSTVAQQQDLLRQQEILRQRMMEFQQQQEQFEREKKSMLSKLQEKFIERDQQLEEARYLEMSNQSYKHLTLFKWRRLYICSIM